MLNQTAKWAHITGVGKNNLKRHKEKFVRASVILDMYGNVCFYCNKEFSDKNLYTLEHVIPKCRGGTLAYTNIVMACPKCNNERSDSLFLDYVQQLLDNLPAEQSYMLQERMDIFLDMRQRIDAGKEFQPFPVRENIHRLWECLISINVVDSSYALVA